MHKQPSAWFDPSSVQRMAFIVFYVDHHEFMGACGFADPVLNLTFLLDHVMENLKPLKWEAVMRSNIPLKVKLPALSCEDQTQQACAFRARDGLLKW